MNQPIDPNTNLPMSLRVERIQQLKQYQAEHETGFTNQLMETNNERKQQRVNDNAEIEKNRIRDKQKEGHNSGEKKDKKDSKGEEKEEKLKQKTRGDKGSIIDIKV